LATPQRCGLGTMQRRTVQGGNRKNMIGFLKIFRQPLCFGMGLAEDLSKNSQLPESMHGRTIINATMRGVIILLEP